MKVFKYFFVLIGVLVFLVIGVGFILPSSSHVERSILIDATPKAVFSLVGDHQMSQRWSPWAEKDPQMQITFKNGTAGLNASMYWSSENPKVGEGSSTFTEYSPNEKVALQLEFGEGMLATANITLTPQQNQTKVIWSFDVKHKSVLSRYFGIFIGDLVGVDFEKGLANLKRESELLPKMITEEVKYELDGVNFTGYLAHPNNNKRNPGVIIVHEWWGHNSYARKRAEMLAELGYSAMALDMYGDGKLAQHPEEAKAFMMEVAQQAGVAESRFDAALTLLKARPETDADNIAAIGYCFGGAVVLNMARLGKDLRGVVSFHGALGGLAPLTETEHKPPALVFNGADDPFVPVATIEAFTSDMDAAGFSYEFINYPGAKHSFTNPDVNSIGEKYKMPLEYNAEADADSWKRMQEFFTVIFK